MGFKEAFTRQGEGENLLFDDDAFYYFAISLLSIVILPLAYTVLKPLSKAFIFGGDKKKFARVPDSPNDQANLARIRKELTWRWFTIGYVLKVILLLFLLVLMQLSYSQLPNQDKIKGFDPYEILEIQPTATDQEVKKAYRRKSLELHPDKNPDDPQANQKFILLTKAYECLTDEDKKAVCSKYGNPDGQQSISVGIAMPSFLLKKENRAAFLALIFLFLLVVVPVIVLNELKSIGKFDDNGVLLSNMPVYERFLEENLIIRKCPGIVSQVGELANAQVKSRNEENDLNRLAKELIEEAELRKISNFEVAEAVEMTKKAKQSKKRVLISKSFILIYGHIFGKLISESLMETYRQTVLTIPKVVNSMIKFAIPFSQKSNIMRLRQMGRIRSRFMGMRCVNNLVQFSQCVVQGIHESDPAINQIGFFNTEASKFSKRSKMPDFTEYINKDPEQRQLPNWIPEEYKEGILKEMNMFPQLKVSHEILVDDDTIDEQCSSDLVKLKISIERLNTPAGREIPYAHSNRFTYIKEEAWHVFLTFDDEIVHYQKLNGSDRLQVSEFNFVPAYLFGDMNQFELLLSVKSDCYRGLDQEVPIKFSLKKASQVTRNVEYHKDDQELDKSMPYIQQMLNPMQRQQEYEESDSEEEESDQGNRQKQD